MSDQMYEILVLKYSKYLLALDFTGMKCWPGNIYCNIRLSVCKIQEENIT